MTPLKKRRSKKNILLMARFQGQVFLFIILTGFVCIALNGYLYYSYVVGSYDFIFGHSNLPQDVVDDRYSELFNLWISLTLVSLLTIVLIGAWTLFITHRAVGPVYHINRVINEIRAGKADERVRLRDKDEFQELARSFNGLMDQMQAGKSKDSG